MAPVVHCVRHAQGFHNLCTENHAIPDPLLTELGEEQCRKLRDSFPSHSQIDLVTASPLRRTVYTALLSFEPVFKERKDLKVIAIPDAQETSDVPCDTGSHPEVLKKEFEEKNLPVDLSLVNEGWNSKQDKWAPETKAIKDRAREARRWLKARPEKEIVLVTHGGFLHYFTEDWEDSSVYQGTGWANTEYRTYRFTETLDTEDLEGYAVDGDNATIAETLESRQRRGKEGPVPSREQQKTFYKLGIQGWDDQGLQLSVAERESTQVPAGKEVNGARV